MYLILYRPKGGTKHGTNRGTKNKTGPSFGSPHLWSGPRRTKPAAAHRPPIFPNQNRNRNGTGNFRNKLPEHRVKKTGTPEKENESFTSPKENTFFPFPVFRFFLPGVPVICSGKFRFRSGSGFGWELAACAPQPGAAGAGWYGPRGAWGPGKRAQAHNTSRTARTGFLSQVSILARERTTRSWLFSSTPLSSAALCAPLPSVASCKLRSITHAKDGDRNWSPRPR